MWLMTLAAREARGLWRRYLGLAVLVAASVMLVGAGLLVTTGAERALETNIAESLAQRSIVVTSDYSSSSGQILDEGHVRSLAAIPGVHRVEPTLNLSVAIYLDGNPVQFSISTLRPSFLPPVLESVRPGITLLAPSEVLLPQTIDDVSLKPLLGREVEIHHDRFVSRGLSSPIRTTVTVVGLTDPAWQQDTPTPAYGNADTIYSWFGLASAEGVAKEVAVQGYHEATVVVDRAERVGPVLRAAQSLGLSATATKDLTPQLPDQLQIVKTLTQVVLVALVLLAMISSSFLVRGLVLQRTREIGLLKSLGYLNRQVWWLLLIEIVLASWVGAFVGLVLATGLGNVGKSFVPPIAAPHTFGGVLLPSLGLIGSSLFVATLVVLLGSLLPVTRAFRLEPAQALRDTL
jgi:ABC-type lipoprotein release transport system permease subunit